MNYEHIRRQVLEAARRTADLGLIHGTSGNLSVREGEVFAITPSGRPYDTMAPEDVAVVTLAGEWIDGPYKPSSETPMHAAVYRARPDAGAVVHTHSLFCTVMAMACDVLPLTTPPHAELAPVPAVPFALPGSGELAELVSAALKQGGRSVLLRNHGCLSLGKDMEGALTAAVYTEEAAQIAWHASLLGKLTPLTAEQIAALQAVLGGGGAV